MQLYKTKPLPWPPATLDELLAQVFVVAEVWFVEVVCPVFVCCPVVAFSDVSIAFDGCCACGWAGVACPWLAFLFVVVVVVLASLSFPLPHPPPPLGTSATVGSFPRFSLFKEGRFAGGGIRRLVATFPKLWRPCLGAPDKERDAFNINLHDTSWQYDKHWQRLWNWTVYAQESLTSLQVYTRSIPELF